MTFPAGNLVFSRYSLDHSLDNNLTDQRIELPGAILERVSNVLRTFAPHGLEPISLPGRGSSCPLHALISRSAGSWNKRLSEDLLSGKCLLLFGRLPSFLFCPRWFLILKHLG